MSDGPGRGELSVSVNPQRKKIIPRGGATPAYAAPVEINQRKPAADRVIALEGRLIAPFSSPSDLGPTDADRFKTQEARTRAGIVVEAMNTDPKRGGEAFRLFRAHTLELGGRYGGLVPSTEEALKASIRDNPHLLTEEALRVLAGEEIGLLSQGELGTLLQQRSEISARATKITDQRAQRVRKADEVQKIGKVRETLAKALDVTEKSLRWLKDLNAEFKLGQKLAGLGLTGGGSAVTVGIIAGSVSAFATPVAGALLVPGILLLLPKSDYD
jgi:hypothetical protein